MEQAKATLTLWSPTMTSRQPTTNFWLFWKRDTQAWPRYWSNVQFSIMKPNWIYQQKYQSISSPKKVTAHLSCKAWSDVFFSSKPINISLWNYVWSEKILKAFLSDLSDSVDGLWYFAVLILYHFKILESFKSAEDDRKQKWFESILS